MTNLGRFLAVAAVALLVFPCVLLGQSKREKSPQASSSESEKPAADKETKQRQALKAYALGEICLRENRVLDALKAFEKSVQLDPEALPARKELIALYITLDCKKEALASCKKALKLDPKDAAVWHACARIYQSQGKMDKARQMLEKGLENIKAEKNLELAQQMYYDLGVLQEEDKQPLAAVRSFTRCAEVLKKILDNQKLELFGRRDLTVRRGLIYERIGKLYAAAGKYDQAIDAYKQAQKINPDNATLWNLNLARISYSQGNYRQALQYVDPYLALKPQGLEAYELKIRLLKKLQRSDEIVPWLEKTSRNDPYNVNLKVLLARQYALHARLRQAERIYLALAKDEPKSQTYKELFRLYVRAPIFTIRKVLDLLDRTLAKTDEKEPLLSQQKAKRQAQAMISALREEKILSKALLTLALRRLNDKGDDLEYDTIRLLAYLAEENRQPAQSEQFYRSLLQRDNPKMEAVVYSGLLRALWKTKQYREVINVCNQGLRKTRATNHVLFHSELARVLAHLKKTDEALKEADQAVRLASGTNRLAMHGLRIRVLMLAQRYKEAEKECEKLLHKYKEPSDIVEIRYLMSNLYSARRNFSKAEEQLQLILKIDPVNATAMNDLGYQWADQSKKLPEAEEMIRRAIELDREQRQTLVSISNTSADKDRAAYVDSLGWVLFRRGKLQQAKKELERATKLPGGEDPVIWDHLGDVYFRLDRAKDAMRCWRKSLQLYEDGTTRSRDQQYRDLQEKIKQLEQASTP